MNEYIGARYVPKFMDTYDPTTSYEALCVVDNGMGTSYISKKPTPAGTPLTNRDYWAIYGSPNGAITHLQDEIDDINDLIADGANIDPYIPVRVGTLVYENASNKKTTVHYAIIDKAYKPKFELGGNAVIDENNNFIFGDVAAKALEHKATIAINAGALHSSGTSCGTVITDGQVRYTCNIDAVEWSGYDLQNLYMTADGELHCIDAFTSVSDMLALDPVWSFNAFSPIYINGAVNNPLDANQISPKAVIGQDFDGNYIVLTTGGRRYNEYGMSYADVTDCVLHSINFNAKLLYNCDGGGSANLIAHQIRQNDLLETEPRKVVSMILFELDDVTIHSDFESGYSTYIREISDNKPANVINSLDSSGYYSLVNINSDNSGVAFYKVSVDADDVRTYTPTVRMTYNDTTHKFGVTVPDQNGNNYTRFQISPDESSVQGLGRELMRARHIYTATAEVTTSSHGFVTGTDIINAEIPSTNPILAAYVSESNKCVITFNHNNNWVFSVKNIDDMTQYASSTVHITIVWADDFVTEAHS